MLKSKDIAEILGIETVTVRKYAAALESAGYIVQRDANGHREFTEIDATAFRELQALQQRTGLTVEKCAEVIATRHKEASDIVAPAVVEPKSPVLIQYEERYNEMIQVMQSQQELIQRQTAELDRLHERMDEQNTSISTILREVLETRRMVAAAAQPKKRWWKRNKSDINEPDPEAAWKRKQEIKDGKY